MNKFSDDLIILEEIIPGGWNFSHHIKKGTCLRLTDIEGGANASTLIFNSADFSERYNMADTLKAQFTSYLTTGNALLSDMGRVLMSIIDDTCGWHDTMTAFSNPESNKKKYGAKNYQEYRNEYYRDSLTSLITEVSKYGMSIRDMHSAINFFTRIDINAKGAISFTPQGKKGAYIDIQAEMDSLVIFNTCPHTMNTNTEYAPKPVKATIWKADCELTENPCYHLRDENKRGFTNTINYYK